MLLCRKTSSLSSRDCCKDHVSQPQRSRFMGIARNSKYLLLVVGVEVGIAPYFLSAPIDAYAAAMRALMSSLSRSRL